MNKGSNENDSKATKREIVAAERGDPAAQVSVGWRYSTGTGVGQDFAAAVHWFRRAATAGNPEGQFYLGVAFHDGDGVNADIVEAIRWYRLAAAQGHTGALFNLGISY